MSKKDEQDPLLKWGHEAAIGALVIGVVVGIAMIARSVVDGGDLESAAARALLIAGLGAAVGFVILWFRKRRERSVRPAWMGSTTAWREGIKAKTAKGASKEDASD